MQIQNFFKKNVWTLFLTVLFVLGILVLGNQFNKDYLKGSLPGPADPAKSSASFDKSAFYAFEEANLIVELKDSNGDPLTEFDGNLNINSISGPCNYDNEFVFNSFTGEANFVVDVYAVRTAINCEFEVFLSDDPNFDNIAGGPFIITAKPLPEVSNISSYIQDDNSRKVFVELKNFPKLSEGYTVTLENINLNATTGADIVHLFDNLELAPCDDIDDDLIKDFFDAFAEENNDFKDFSLNSADVDITDTYSIKVFLANVLQDVKLPPAYKNDVEDLLTCLEDTFQKSSNTVQSTFANIELTDVDNQLTQETQRILSFEIPSTVSIPFNINVQSDVPNIKEINFLVSGNFIEDTESFDVTTHEFALTPRVIDVVVKAKTPEHPVQTGSTNAFVINNEQGPKLILERGKEYVFNLDTTIDHPFYITQSAAGGPGLGGADDQSWDTGVTNNGSTTGQLKFKPDDTTPDLLYYQCGNHLNMGWEIEIVDPELECISPEDIANQIDHTTTPFSITKDTLLCGGESYTLDNGIVIDNTNATLSDPVTLNCSDVTINGNFISSIAGILIDDEEFVEVKNCRVRNYEAGIVISKGSKNLLEKNTIEQNQTAGIALLSSTSDNTIKSNTVSQNQQYGIYLEDSTNNTFEKNDIKNNTEIGIYFLEGSDDNILKKNTICGHLPPTATDISTFNAPINISIDDSSNDNQCDNWYDKTVDPLVPEARDAICVPCPEEQDKPFISEEESLINANNKKYTLTLGNHPDIIDQYKWSKTKVRIYSGIDDGDQLILAEGDDEECVINFANAGVAPDELDCTDGSVTINLDLYDSTAEVIDTIKTIQMTDYTFESITD